MTAFATRSNVPDEDARVIADALALTLATLDAMRDMLGSRDVTFRRKADGSVVSATDHVIQARFAAAISATFATHEVISEEGVRESGSARWRWVIDPLDGTSNFTSGLPFWCVSVALTCDGHVVLGVIDAPDLNRRFMAVTGGGAWVTDGTGARQVSVRGAVDLFDNANQQIPLMLTPSTLVAARNHKIVLRQRVLGATALDLALVADGTAAASVALVPHVWDIAAGVLLVREAGGVVLAQTDVLLPLLANSDYQVRQGAVVAGADEGSLRELAQLVLPKTCTQTLSPLQ
ncbi:MAG: inositol monophosphatase [Nitriliruptoraceae bacterium]